MSVGRTVCAALDPVLGRAGFARGQGAEGGGAPYAQIIFCAAYDEFSDRYPWMPQANDQERSVGACVDLVVNVSADGKIESVDLEGPSLEVTLRNAGHAEDADSAAELKGQLLVDALPILSAVLARLFDRARASG